MTTVLVQETSQPRSSLVQAHSTQPLVQPTIRSNQGSVLTGAGHAFKVLFPPKFRNLFRKPKLGAPFPWVPL